MSFKDVMDRAFEHFEMQAEAQKNITIEGKYIVIREQNSFVYAIPLDDCCTVWGALEWVMHMMEKNWVTEEKMNRIAGLMSRYAREQHNASIARRHYRQRPVMCNRTDCAGVFMGELACRVCEEGKMGAYEAQHAVCGLAVGDKVRVTRRPDDYEHGWQGGWDNFCEQAIGKEFEIRRDDGEYGFSIALHVRGSIWVYPRVPFFVLEKVEAQNDAA